MVMLWWLLLSRSVWSSDSLPNRQGLYMFQGEIKNRKQMFLKVFFGFLFEFVILLSFATFSLYDYFL